MLQVQFQCSWNLLIRVDLIESLSKTGMPSFRISFPTLFCSSVGHKRHFAWVLGGQIDTGSIFMLHPEGHYRSTGSYCRSCLMSLLCRLVALGQQPDQQPQSPLGLLSVCPIPGSHRGLATWGKTPLLLLASRIVEIEDLTSMRDGHRFQVISWAPLCSCSPPLHIHLPDPMSIPLTLGSTTVPKTGDQ